MYMVHNKKENPSLVIRINKETRLQTLFVFFWVYNSLIMSGVDFTAGFIGLTDYTNVIRTVLIMMVLIYASPAILKYIRFSHLILYLAIMMVYVMTFIVFPDNTKWLQENIVEFAFLILPFVFLGFIANKMRIPYQTLVVCSRLIIVMMIAVFLFYSVLKSDHEMGRAYVVLPSVMLVTQSLIKKWNIWDLAAAVVGFIFLLMCATRGPILLYLIFVLIQLLMVSDKHRKLYIFLLSLVVLLVVSPLGSVLAKSVMERFAGAGFNVRIFEYLLSGNIMDDNGRDYLTERVFEMIRNRPLMGNGIYSDRLATSYLSWLSGEGSYVHNIIYELWCDFGYIIGSLLLIIFVWMAIRTWKNERNTDFRTIFLLMMLANIGRLMMSSSYLELSGFWVCLGICFECSRRKKYL